MIVPNRRRKIMRFGAIVFRGKSGGNYSAIIQRRYKRELWWELQTEKPASDLGESHRFKFAIKLFSNSVFDAADDIVNSTLA
jgi:hypothetical protein